MLHFLLVPLNTYLACALGSTKDLQVDRINKLLEDCYDMWQIFTDMKDVGHSGASRPRTYVIFARKDRVMLRSPVSLFETITERIAQVIQTRPRDYLTADQLEIDLGPAARTGT